MIEVNLAAIPASLVSLDRWMLWTEVERNGKKTKKPMTSAGRAASSTDDSTWTDFNTAAGVLRLRLQGFDGIGIAFGPLADPAGEALGGIDFDACLDANGNLAAWAAPIVALLLGTFGEISPSGFGLKFFFRSSVADIEQLRAAFGIEPTKWGTKKSVLSAANGQEHGPAIECYFGIGRYFTCTGVRWADAAADVQYLDLPTLLAIAALVREITGTAGKKPPGRDQSRSAIAFRMGTALFRDGKTFDEMCAALRAHPDTAEWVVEKGDANNGRELQRIWDAAARNGGQARLYATVDAATLWDPWATPPVPAWPNAILSREVEDTLAAICLRDGFADLGVPAMALFAATSGAAPKSARFFPYSVEERGWRVPPILWLMQIGASGHRKTALDSVAFAPLRHVQALAWGPYQTNLRAWRGRPAKERGPKPEEPHSWIVDDVTPEALQRVLANTSRGTALVKDELAGLFEFDRYRQGGSGSAGRAFYLSAYEDHPCSVHRITRDSTYIQHSGVSIFGGIQPDRLAEFGGLETDGLLPRFLPQRVGATTVARPEIDPGRGLEAVHHAIERLCWQEALHYTATPDGIALIQSTEREARDFATITDFAAGWPAFCFKLHGTHARLALVLHLLEAPDAPVISTDTIERAHRLVHHYVLQHAADFYGSIPGGNRDRMLDIAGWLLIRQDPDTVPGLLERIVPSDLTNGIRSCRALGSKGITEALDPFVVRGWLQPENDYPGNRAWLFDPVIRERFAERQQAEIERRAMVRARLDRLRAGLH